MWLHVPESCRSVPASECSTSESDSPALELARSCTWRGKSRQPRSWQRVCETEAYAKLLSGLTSRPSTLELGAEEWISSLADSHASRSAPPASAEASRTNAGSGATSPESSKTASLKPFSLRMCVGLFDMDLPPSCQTLPPSGSMRNGICSELPTSAHRTSGRGSSSSEFPTPDGQVRTGFNTRPGPAGKRPLLAELAKNWPTATAGDANGSGSRNTPGSKAHQGVSLSDMVTTGDSRGRQWATPMAHERAQTPRPVHHGIQLANQVDAWPTASANDHKGSHRIGQRRGQLDEAAEQKWPSPRTSDTNGPGKHGTGGLDLRTKAAGWATPMASDGSKPSAGNRRSADLSHQAQDQASDTSGESTTTGCRSPLAPPTENGGLASRPKLNPLFVEWLIGCPCGWTAFEPVGTESFQSWRRLHSELLQRVLADTEEIAA